MKYQEVAEEVQKQTLRSKRSTFLFLVFVVVTSAMTNIVLLFDLSRTRDTLAAVLAAAKVSQKDAEARDAALAEFRSASEEHRRRSEENFDTLAKRIDCAVRTHRFNRRDYWRMYQRCIANLPPFDTTPRETANTPLIPRPVPDPEPTPSPSRSPSPSPSPTPSPSPSCRVPIPTPGPCPLI